MSRVFIDTLGRTSGPRRTRMIQEGFENHSPDVENLVAKFASDNFSERK